MKNQKFEIRTWMSENRELVIASYEALTNEKFFNGVSLKVYMTEVLNAMVMNRIGSAKTASAKLPFLMGNIYVNNSKVFARDLQTEALKAKYNGTAYMALV
jgi:hypothetical protein